ncbi:MAG: hypothetical protein OXH22_06125 [Chloroflexi bacterium]|nr:hypothetical protein [Chloroflexota bacterium]
MRAIPASTIVIVFASLILASFMASGGAAAQTGCGIQLLTSNTVQGSWTSDCTSQYRQDSYARSYSLRLTEPAEVTITLESEADPYLFLHSEQGDFIDENDDIDLDVRNYNSRIIASLSAGSYTIEATTYLERVTGDFTLTVTGVDFSASDDNDRAALTALYHATDGDNWRRNDNWLTNAPLDEWYGVDTDGNRWVHDLSLNDNQLTGQLPSELGELYNPKGLDFGNNQLTGPIPSELGNLNLALLILSRNQLTGTIPSELSRMANLVELDLSGNELSGQIPPELGNLSHLRSLFLGFNYLEGEIPSEIANLSNLDLLDLAVNNLSGEIPPELGDLTNLVSLRLGSNELTGRIPPELGELVNLWTLNLGDNNLSGTIPPGLAELSNLRNLSLRRNELTGEIPPWIGNLSNLESLGLHVNNLTGEIPAELGKLTQLEHLNLYYNYLSSEIPPELGTLANLNSLGLGGNNLTGEVPSEFGNLANLEELSLSNNLLTGSLPHSLTALKSLEEFAFHHNDGLCAPADEPFQEWLLGVYDVDGNTCGVPLPSSNQDDIEALTALYNATNGDHWKRNRNWLTDVPVSEWYGVVTDAEGRVTHLYLSDNNLSGVIPSELGNVSNLKSLVLFDNHLTGEFSSELTKLTELTLLYFDYNAGLCAPTDATFQAWLQSVINVQGPNCDAAEPPTPEPTPSPSPTPTPMPGNPIPEGCTLQSIVGSDSTIDDAWTSDCVSQNRMENGEHYAKFFGFTVDRTSSIDITLVSRTDTYMFLLDEYGMVVEENDNYDHNIFDLHPRSSGIRIKLDPGNYIVEATTYANEATGDFTLTIASPDITALRALYRATNGANWTNNDNWLTDAPLSEWHGVTTDDEGSVTEIYLIGNNLVGTIPAELGGMYNLEGLYLARNQLSGAIPPELGNLHNLETLMLFRNELSGAIPSELGSLASLKELHLGRNQLSGAIPVTLGNLQNLTRLHMTVNELSGAIPASLGNLTELRQLSIASNNLSGPIPTEIADLSNLTHIYLWDNNLLAGRFVNSLDRMTELRFLDIGGNNIDGEDVLAELYALHNLTGLGIHNSYITDDHMSAYMDDLQALDLEFLNLSENNLSDLQTLVDLSEIETIQRLVIHSNDLSGELPRTMTRLTLMRLFYFHANAGLCAPTDDEFQDWLRGIRDVLGDTCTDGSPTDAPARQSSGDEFAAMMSVLGEAEDNHSLLSR